MKLSAPEIPSHSLLLELSRSCAKAANFGGGASKAREISDVAEKRADENGEGRPDHRIRHN